MRWFVGLLAMACAMPWGQGAAAEGMERATRLKVMKSVVKLRVLMRRGDQLVQAGHGSGSIISSDGLILTNNHVVQNTRTGRLFDAIAVAPNTGFDKAPKSECIAYPKRAIRHAKLDLALIKCESEMDGSSLRRKLNWPTVTVGDSSTLIPGDELFIVGFPGVGGATITFTSGKVSGFLADRRVGKGRAWIKTDALISGGVSGGSGFDASGTLVGVPTAYRRGKRGHTNIGLVRVVNKAKPMLAMARTKAWGKLPRVAKVMPRSPEQGSGLGYRQAPRGARPLPRRLPPMGLGKGPSAHTQRPPRRPGPMRDPGHVTPPNQRPPRAGAVPRPGSGYSAITGRVVNHRSRPVRGAVVVLLKPGVDVFRVAPKTLRYAVVTSGVADTRGFFRGIRPVRQGGRHGLIVAAQGYAPLRINNAVHLLKGSPPMLNLGLVRLRPRGGRRRAPARLPQFEEIQE